ncbi:hypothetical protein B0H13DRAFT_2143789, partial [Mycena leptocephala]
MGWVRNQRRGGCKNSGGAALRIARRLRAAQGIRLAQWLHVRVAGGKRDGGDCVLELTWWNWWQQSSGVGEKAAAGYVFAFTVFLHHTHTMHFRVCGVGESRGFWSGIGLRRERVGRGSAWEVCGRCAGGVRVCFSRNGRERRLQIRPGIHQTHRARFPLHGTSTASG